MTRTCLLSLVVAVLWAPLALAQPAPDPAPAPTGPTAPAAKPKPPDVMAGAIDPMNLMTERGKFFTAAGVDSELSAEEFALAKGRKGSFVRNYDNYKAMLAFDKDRNGRVDWFEVLNYRQDLRVRVITAYDANKDGKLVGEERDKANADLAAGKVPARARVWTPPAEWQRTKPEDVKTYDTDKDGKLSGEERRAMWKQRFAEREKETLAKYDANKNGQLDPEERQAAAKEAMDQWLTRAHDKDGDGQLSEAEAQELAKDRARIEDMRKQWAQRRDEMVKQYDADEDGELNQEERRAMMEGIRQEWMVKAYDKDGDGELNEKEKAVRAQDEQRTKAMADMWRKHFTRKYDVDGDGQLSEDEQAFAREDVGKQLRELGQEWMAQWDTNEDGELDAEERKEMRAAVANRVAELRKELDADGDGKITPPEIRNFLDKLRQVYDTDEDGVLSPDEARAMIREQMKMFRRGARPEPRE